MGYGSDEYATMLLTMALSPNREEYARPFSVQEFNKILRRVRQSSYHSIGDLLGVDISGLMLHLDISEEEGYRIFTLLNRGVQLGYSMDTFMAHGVEVLTMYNASYPDRLRRKMGEIAPPFFYHAGNLSLLSGHAIAIVGISGVKTTPDVRDGISSIVRAAIQKNYSILTGGELGVSRIAASAVLEQGGTLIDVLGGGLYEHLEYETIAALLKENRAAVLSLEHPEALFTVSHAIARNKVLFALADAAFICNTDNKRGEIDVIRNRYCDWIYAWSGYPANQALISRGAVPVSSLGGFDLEAACVRWNEPQPQQINFFDLFDDQPGKV